MHRQSTSSIVRRKLYMQFTKNTDSSVGDLRHDMKVDDGGEICYSSCELVSEEVPRGSVQARFDFFFATLTRNQKM